MNIRDRIRNYRPSKARPERGEISSEERIRNYWRLKVLAEWQESGKLVKCDEQGNYRYTLEDCKAEAARRQEEGKA